MIGKELSGCLLCTQTGLFVPPPAVSKGDRSIPFFSGGRALLFSVLAPSYENNFMLKSTEHEIFPAHL